MRPSPDPGSRSPAGERRAYYRVGTCLPLRIQRGDPAACERLRREIESSVREPTLTAVEAPLEARLARIEQKLDRVLAQLGGGEPPLGRRDLTPVRLSGSGLACRVGGRPRLDEEVVVEMLLPGGAPEPVRAVARVVSAEPAGENASQVAFAFTAIDELDREAIVRYVSAAQRRERRREAGSR